MNRIKKNSKIIVISGSFKGKKGSVIKSFPKQKKIIVKNVNIIKKHIKSNPNKNIKGGILKKESKIDISNVKIYKKSNNK